MMRAKRLKLLESMAAPFSARLAEEVVVVEVPEWLEPGNDGEPGTPLIIYSRPMNLEQRDQVYKLMAEGSTLLSFAEALLMMAHDGDGELMFREGIERDTARNYLLRKVDPDEIYRVVHEMRAGKPLVDKPDEAIEEASGN